MVDKYKPTDDQVLVVEDGMSGKVKERNPREFCIREVLTEVDRAEAERRFGMFRNLEVPSDTSLPLYILFRTQFAYNDGQSNRIDLVDLTLIAERLGSEVEKRNPEYIHCGDVEPQYEAVVADVAASYELPTNADRPITIISRLKRYFSAVIGLIPFFLDEVFSRLWAGLFGLPSETNTLVVPSVGRFGSVRPVLEVAEFDFEVIISPMTLSVLSPGTDFSSIFDFKPTTFSQFITISALISQFRILSEVFNELFIYHTLEQGLINEIAEETGIVLHSTVDYGLYSVFDSSHLRDLMYYPLAERAIKLTNPKNLVLGSGAPFGKTVCAAGQNNDVDCYLIPHGIKAPRPGAHYPNITEFLSSELDYQYIKSREYETDMSTYVVAGRPYLEELDLNFDNNLIKRMKKEGKLRILIITAPQSDKVRCTLVNQVLKNTSQLDTDIVIKIHPIESKEFYQNNFDVSKVTIADSNLFEHLLAADLVVMLRSNVGLEGIFCGTPCVSVNFWSPSILVHPYVTESPIPVLRSPGEVEEFFDNLSADMIKKLYYGQESSVKQQYTSDGASENIISYIKDETDS